MPTTLYFAVASSHFTILTLTSLDVESPIESPARQSPTAAFDGSEFTLSTSSFQVLRAKRKMPPQQTSASTRMTPTMIRMILPALLFFGGGGAPNGAPGPPGAP